MLLGIAGVTGIGKSFFKDILVSRLGFEKIKIITTREIRVGEKNYDDKIFVTNKELDDLWSDGKIAYEFELLGNRYAYTKEETFSDKNMVFEMHYSTIFEFKKVCPHLVSIYVFPNNIDNAKNITRQRNLNPIIEKNRLLEIDEHYSRMCNDDTLRNMFDYILYNNYDKDSENNVISLVKNILQKGE